MNGEQLPSEEDMEELMCEFMKFAKKFVESQKPIPEDIARAMDEMTDEEWEAMLA